MATVINGNQVKKSDGSIVTAQQGAWYDGQQFWGGTLSSAGSINSQSNQLGAGQKVSNEVISQTNPNNVGYIESQIGADNIQQAPQINLPQMGATAGVVSGLNDAVTNARNTLQTTLSARKETVDQKLNVLKEKEQAALDEIGTLTTPFRAELEAAQREKLHVNENFEANQKLVDELDQLLTQGNDLIKQQQQVTGLSAIRNPRIQQTMNDVAARAGVIEAVMNARNGQIAQANNLIDRTAKAIEDDRKDEISYYETIINLNNRDIITLSQESKELANEQLAIVKGDLNRAQATQDYVKQLMMDPASAALMGEAGVSLNDSVESITQKLSDAQYVRDVRDQANEIALKGGQPVFDPSSVPANQLVSFTDSKGKEHYYKMPASSAGGNSSFTDSFLAKTLLGIDDIKEGTEPLMNTDYADILQIADDVLSPPITPTAGIGSIYYDSLGRKWVYESSGWNLIG